MLFRYISREAERIAGRGANSRCRIIPIGILAAALTLVMSEPVEAQMPTVTSVPGRPALLLGSFDLSALGYRSDEFFVTGTASSYQVAPAGVGTATIENTAPFVTRFVVTRPSDPKKFNGTVMVEWDNVSGGQDVPTEWMIAHRELIRSGYVHVAVSVQKVGIDGGDSLSTGGMPLKMLDAERYKQLSHPGDAFAFDIFSQVGRVLRGPDASRVLGGLVPKRIVAAGESQSAAFLTTYINVVDALAKVYDGFLVHSRSGGEAPITGASLLHAGTPRPDSVPFRDNLRVPVLTVLTETDVLGSRLGGYYPVRVSDNQHLRVWEIAGAAHADNYLFGLAMQDSGSLSIEELARGFAPTRQAVGGMLDKPANTGLPHHYVMQAAIASLDRWLKSAVPPAHGIPLKVIAGPQPMYARDDNGLVMDGVRTPWVDVPTVRLAGNGNSGGPVAMLAGVAEPFDAATLARLYPQGKDQFMKLFEASLEKAIDAGFLLRADRAEILAVAATSYGNTAVALRTTPSSSIYTTAATPIGQLLDDEGAKTILLKHVPGLVNSPQIAMARGLTLKAIQSYSPTLTDATLADIDAELAALPPH